MLLVNCYYIHLLGIHMYYILIFVFYFQFISFYNKLNGWHLTSIVDRLFVLHEKGWIFYCTEMRVIIY